MSSSSPPPGALAAPADVPSPAASEPPVTAPVSPTAPSAPSAPVGSVRRVAGTAGAVLLALAVLLGLQLRLHDGAPVALDLGASTWAASVRAAAPWTETVALWLNWVGGGFVAIWVVPAAILVGLLLARRWRGAVTTAVALIVSAGAVQLVKNSFDRVRPETTLVTSDHGSFPSGHTANAATLAVLAVVLVPPAWRRWTALVGALWVVVMATSRLILSIHWATDLVGGAFAGLGAALVVVALLPAGRRIRLPPPGSPGGR
ncbi:phosphatase PAP2 family protein [Salana multivorans]|uniref:phosphatase PAP2 family protein n=1 Tax=Salana multivorans TaxID=120377 RepID=UPI001B8790A7|nr:phosphatase PAP2 family protein [Salana multivorans]